VLLSYIYNSLLDRYFLNYIPDNSVRTKRKMKKNQRNIFLIVGLLISSISQIGLHFTQMSDFVSGIIMGIGIGVMLLAFIKQRRKHLV